MEQPRYTWPYGALYTEATPADDENLRTLRRAAAQGREAVLARQKAAGKAGDRELARELKQVAGEMLRWERAVNLFRAHLFGEGEPMPAGHWPPEMATELLMVDGAMLYPELVPGMAAHLRACGEEPLP